MSSLKANSVNKEKLKRYIFGYLCILPAFFFFMLFFLTPLFKGIVVSLKQYSSGELQFVGFANYIRVFTDPEFWNSLRVSIVFTVFFIIFSAGLGLLLGLYLVERRRFYLFIVAAFFVPYISTPVIGALVWKNILADPYGIFNTFIGLFGLEPISWFKNPRLAMASLIIIQVWYTMGYNAVLFLAGLQAIPKSYFEASDLEGSTFIQKMRFIILPLLIPTLVFVITISTLYGFVNSYVLAKLITNNGPFQATNVMMSYIFDLGFNRFDLPRANAVTMVVFVLFVFLAFIQFRYQNKHYHGLD
ncbi:MAG: sugar ABC transporter permease [Spirochaetia bacterium]|nr:sugar ABC transporter permease [Spirochaetia bacterium]MCF7945974.1 sugar ABC transporter permease [Spirochaetia bacterium]